MDINIEVKFINQVELCLWISSYSTLKMSTFARFSGWNQRLSYFTVEL